jgi:Ethylbenzene dehydrogenase
MITLPRTSWGALTVVFFALAFAGCDGDDGAAGAAGPAGAAGAAGADGTDGADGADGTNANTRDLPTLQGHIPAFPEANFHGNGDSELNLNLDDDRILPYDVQAAYNADTFFWRVSYRGNEGKRHEYIRYTNGAWQREGGDRRDAQATLDGDVQQGDQSVNSTIYEQRTTIMVNDPGAAVNVDNFGEFGCFLSCHNYSRHMPEWTAANGHDGKYIDPVQATGSASGDPVLDLWHWRGARSNPIGRADDQNILSLDFVPNDGNGGDTGGRKGDAGTSVFRSQGMDAVAGPDFLMDPGTTSGKFAFAWDNFWETPFYYMVDDNAQGEGPRAPNPGIIAYADAVAMGYSPTEGDTVPRRILRAGAGSRADITSIGTTFTPETPDSSYGVWNVQMQRDLDTGNADDVAMVPGQLYEAGFEVHLWEYTTRDHYVSFPVTVGLETAADVVAVNIAGSGPEQGPNWTEIPKTRLDLFQPGINTWEFLTGDGGAQASKEYFDAADQLVNQTHFGASGVNAGTACTVCHSVRAADGGSSMEELADNRGGVWEDTPVVAPPAP